MSLLSEKKVSVLQAQEIVAPQVYLGVSPQIPQSLNVASAVYNFAADGGAVGVYNLVLSKPIPAGSAVGNFFVNAIVPVTSNGAPTYSLGLNNATDLVNAQVIVGVPTAMTFANLVATNNVYSLTFTIAGAPLTAGEVEFRLAYA